MLESASFLLSFLRFPAVTALNLCAGKFSEPPAASAKSITEFLSDDGRSSQVAVPISPPRGEPVFLGQVVRGRAGPRAGTIASFFRQAASLPATAVPSARGEEDRVTPDRSVSPSYSFFKSKTLGPSLSEHGPDPRGPSLSEHGPDPRRPSLADPQGPSLSEHGPDPQGPSLSEHGPDPRGPSLSEHGPDPRRPSLADPQGPSLLEHGPDHRGPSLSEHGPDPRGPSLSEHGPDPRRPSLADPQGPSLSEHGPDPRGPSLSEHDLDPWRPQAPPPPHPPPRCPSPGSLTQCARCGEHKASWEMPEHEDFHFALDLQESFSAPCLLPPAPSPASPRMVSSTRRKKTATSQLVPAGKRPRTSSRHTLDSYFKKAPC
uniref:DNA polymerase eta-like n=1 Tax=Pristiophorus japonicus TaxID=55135 RepID=UPI00398F8567